MIESILAGVVGFAIFLGALVVAEVVKGEYMNWAGALARALVKVAGFICPWRRTEWLNDVLYLQSARSGRNESGLWLAISHLLGAPKNLLYWGRRPLSGRGRGGVPVGEALAPLVVVFEGTTHAVARPGPRTKTARCCTPKPLEPIVAYRRKNDRWSVHRADCTNLTNGLDIHRLLPARWADHIPPDAGALVMRVRFDRTSHPSARELVASALRSQGWKVSDSTVVFEQDDRMTLHLEVVPVHATSVPQAQEALERLGGLGIRVVGHAQVRIEHGDVQ